MLVEVYNDPDNGVITGFINGPGNPNANMDCDDEYYIVTKVSDVQDMKQQIASLQQTVAARAEGMEDLRERLFALPNAYHPYLKTLRPILFPTEEGKEEREEEMVEFTDLQKTVAAQAKTIEALTKQVTQNKRDFQPYIDKLRPTYFPTAEELKETQERKRKILTDEMAQLETRLAKLKADKVARDREIDAKWAARSEAWRKSTAELVNRLDLNRKKAVQDIEALRIKEECAPTCRGSCKCACHFCTDENF